uniref:WSN domain-containing protein n=1 Tax=Rhabditophanes sp. KR3021 TaxID=114890 RepID=A0AC35TG12_9BILA
MPVPDKPSDVDKSADDKRNEDKKLEETLAETLEEKSCPSKDIKKEKGNTPSVVKKKEKTVPLHINTDSQNILPAWVGGNSPARFVSTEDLMTMNSTIERMMIAHEIAIDPDFSIAKLIAPANELEKTISDSLHRAFWDILKEAAEKNSGDEANDYKQQMLDLLKELKKSTLTIVPKTSTGVISEIRNVLDDDILRNQSEEGIIDYKDLLTKTVNLLSKLCASDRDHIVVDILKEPVLLKQFEETFQLLKLMKIDYENYSLSKNKKLFLENSSIYEYEQFKQLLAVDKNAATYTNKWLKKVFDNSEYAVLATLDNSAVSEIITQAYMHLLTHYNDPEFPETFPETFKFDQIRVEALSLDYHRLVIILTAIFITSNLSGKEIAESKDFKKELKKNLLILLEDLSLINLPQKLENIFLQCEAEIKKTASSFSQYNWSEAQKNELKTQIMSIENPQNAVRKIATTRINSFIQNLISERINTNNRVPIGLSVIYDELVTLIKSFVHLTTHNRKTYGTLYGKYIEKIASAYS